MKNHTKIYFDFFGYGTEDFIPSELSGQRAVDIHHIEARGMGGSKSSNSIFNLMALTREEHNAFGDIEELKEFLKYKHFRFILANQERKVYRGEYPELEAYAQKFIENGPDYYTNIIKKAAKLIYPKDLRILTEIPIV